MHALYKLGGPCSGVSAAQHPPPCLLSGLMVPWIRLHQLPGSLVTQAETIQHICSPGHRDWLRDEHGTQFRPRKVRTKVFLFGVFPHQFSSDRNLEGSGLEVQAAIVPMCGVGEQEDPRGEQKERGKKIHAYHLGYNYPLARLPLNCYKGASTSLFKSRWVGFFWHLQLNEPSLMYLLSTPCPSITPSYQAEVLLWEKTRRFSFFCLPSSQQ